MAYENWEKFFWNKFDKINNLAFKKSNNLMKI